MSTQDGSPVSHAIHALTLAMRTSRNRHAEHAAAVYAAPTGPPTRPAGQGSQPAPGGGAA